MRLSLAEIVILADDLSGAAETASMLASAVPAGVPLLLLRSPGDVESVVPGPMALDTDTRHAQPESAFRAVQDTLSCLPCDRFILKKVDSLLRGNIAAELSAIARTGRVVVLAPALPRLNRVVRDSQPLVDGIPLPDTAIWRLESSVSRASPTHALPGAVAVTLAAVRRRGGLRSALRAARPGSVLICDAETDADLDLIASAVVHAQQETGHVAVAGSAAIAAALVRVLGAPVGNENAPGPVSAAARTAFVVGTAEPQARAQVEELRARGAHVLTLDPLRLLSDRHSEDTVAAMTTALKAPVSVTTVGNGMIVDPGSAELLSRRLAGLVASAHALSPPAVLTLTGGATARAVLDALRVERLTVRHTISSGAALSTTDSGQTVVTRPGSYGDADDLLRILARVSPSAYSTLNA